MANYIKNHPMGAFTLTIFWLILLVNAFVFGGWQWLAPVIVPVMWYGSYRLGQRMVKHG